MEPHNLDAPETFRPSIPLLAGDIHYRAQMKGSRNDLLLRSLKNQYKTPLPEGISAFLQMPENSVLMAIHSLQEL